MANVGGMFRINDHTMLLGVTILASSVSSERCAGASDPANVSFEHNHNSYAYQGG